MPDDRPSPWSTYAPTHAPGGPPPGWSAPPAHGAPHPAQTALDLYGLRPAAPAYAAPPVGPVPSPPAAERRLATLAVVLAGLALLGVLLMVVYLFASNALDTPDGGDGPYPPMRGNVVPAAGTTAVAGDALAAAVTQTVRDDGGYPEGITCPATPKVAQDVTTVCHGSDDGVESAFVVFFEDAKGAYTLLEL